MIFQLQTLGTASAMPVSDRNPSAQVLSVQGRLFLIDCGEGTQQQMRRCHLSFLKVEAIFISHTHGDHIFGLPGLLNTMSLYGRTGRLDIYGPTQLGEIIDCFKKHFSAGEGYELVFHPLEGDAPQKIHISRHLEVTAFPLRHKIPCWGYRFDERVSERHRSANPLYEAKSYAYCSDTAPFGELPSYVRGVNTLFHEATYPDSLADKAQSYFHSTTRQAARCALEAGVRRLIVGHYSSRIKDYDEYLRECREIFPESYAASDGDLFDI